MSLRRLSCIQNLGSLRGKIWNIENELVKCKIARNDKISLSLVVKNNPRVSLRSMANNLNSSRGLNVSHETVRRTLIKMGYSKKAPVRGPNITPTHEKTRVAWAKKHRLIHWQKVFFTDECSIWLNVGNLHIWTKGSQRPVRNLLKHTPKLHIWGGISARGATPVHIFREKFNLQAYCNVLNEVLIENASTLYPDGWKHGWKQEDNSSIHKSRLSTAYKDFRGIRTIDWSSNSPDLNPIENLWAVLKHRIQVNAPRSIRDVETMIKEEWETFEPFFSATSLAL